MNVFLVDADLNPLTHGAVYDADDDLFGSFLWTRQQAAPHLGQMPVRGFGFAVREVMPCTHYKVVYRLGRYVIVPHEANGA